jgi:hypothetical protein
MRVELHARNAQIYHQRSITAAIASAILLVATIVLAILGLH